jgi:hypothetical protein
MKGTEEKTDVLPSATIDDMRRMRAIAAGCQMKLVSAKFIAKNNAPRVKSFTLANWDFEKADSREISLRCFEK